MERRFVGTGFLAVRVACRLLGLLHRLGLARGAAHQERQRSFRRRGRGRTLGLRLGGRRHVALRLGLRGPRQPRLQQRFSLRHRRPSRHCRSLERGPIPQATMDGRPALWLSDGGRNVRRLLRRRGDPRARRRRRGALRGPHRGAPVQGLGLSDRGALRRHGGAPLGHGDHRRHGFGPRGDRWRARGGPGGRGSVHPFGPGSGDRRLHGDRRRRWMGGATRRPGPTGGLRRRHRGRNGRPRRRRLQRRFRHPRRHPFHRRGRSGAPRRWFVDRRHGPEFPDRHDGPSGVPGVHHVGVLQRFAARLCRAASLGVVLHHGIIARGSRRRAWHGRPIARRRQVGGAPCRRPLARTRTPWCPTISISWRFRRRGWRA